ncbi:chemotaxis protein CheD [Desulfohalovibrio reitneri]|uniref:chemotaxis protein CheD n=1 Tax=Desulfohalovibrio reitneri TaxID=1307759 RepID=UPI000AACB3AF|nr:chemotaxis protein CheD [Desulfohalovibrio reitneri]
MTYPPNRVVVGISDMRVSTSPRDLLITYSLGSCVALAVYDPDNGVGGLVHCLLPLARLAPKKAEVTPAMFVTTGVSALIRQMFRKGAKRGNLVLKAAGGAHMLGLAGAFDTGARNTAALCRLLEKNELPLSAHEFGGTVPRTFSLDMRDGSVVVKSLGKEKAL